MPFHRFTLQTNKSDSPALLRSNTMNKSEHRCILIDVFYIIFIIHTKTCHLSRPNHVLPVCVIFLQVVLSLELHSFILFHLIISEVAGSNHNSSPPQRDNIQYIQGGNSTNHFFPFCFVLCTMKCSIEFQNCSSFHFYIASILMYFAL